MLPRNSPHRHHHQYLYLHPQSRAPNLVLHACMQLVWLALHGLLTSTPRPRVLSARRLPRPCSSYRSYMVHRTARCYTDAQFYIDTCHYVLLTAQGRRHQLISPWPSPISPPKNFCSWKREANRSSGPTSEQKSSEGRLSSLVHVRTSLQPCRGGQVVRLCRSTVDSRRTPLQQLFSSACASIDRRDHFGHVAMQAGRARVEPCLALKSTNLRWLQKVVSNIGILNSTILLGVLTEDIVVV